MCNPILDFLVHVWIIFTSYFSRTPTPTVLPLSTASSSIYASRSRTYASSGTKVDSEPGTPAPLKMSKNDMPNSESRTSVENWKAQKEQFLRHPSLRRSSSHRSTRTADGSQRSARTQNNSATNWEQYVGQEQNGESLVPHSVSPNLPAVIVTPCTPSVDDTNPPENDLQFTSPFGSPLDMTIASYKAILPFPTILKKDRTPSRRRRDKEKSTGRRIRFDTDEGPDILDDLDNPFRLSGGSTDFSSPEGDHISCFPDSTLLPAESPPPPAAGSTLRNHHHHHRHHHHRHHHLHHDEKDDEKHERMAYLWDYPSWTTNTDRINIADPNLPSYMTSTPPKKPKFTGVIQDDGIGAQSSFHLATTAMHASMGLEKGLSDDVHELLPYPDVFDLDMYFCEISMRRSLPPRGITVTSATDFEAIHSTTDNINQPHEFDIGTTTLGPGFEYNPDKDTKDSEPTTPPSNPFSQGGNRLWTINDNKFSMSNKAVEADIVTYKDVYRHTAYSKPSAIIYSTKLPSPPPMKIPSPPSNNQAHSHSPMRPLISPASMTPTSPTRRSTTEITSTNPSPAPPRALQQQRLSPIVLPPPPIVIVSQYPFDTIKPRRNRTPRNGGIGSPAESPTNGNKISNSSLTSFSGPKPEDLMGDSADSRSMESLKARLKEAYDNFSKPTWMDESESWERVPLT